MRRLWLVPALALVLAGCGGGTPEGEVRGDVQSILDAANFRNAEDLRQEVDDLLSTLRAQVANGEIDRARAEVLRTLALRIQENAGLLEPEPSPEPTEEPEPSPEPEPEPTEEPEPSPEPEPEETEDPEPEPEPEPTEEEPIVDATIVPTDGGVESPSSGSVTQPASQSSPAPKPSPKPTA